MKIQKLYFEYNFKAIYTGYAGIPFIHLFDGDGKQILADSFILEKYFEGADTFTSPYAAGINTDLTAKNGQRGAYGSSNLSAFLNQILIDGFRDFSTDYVNNNGENSRFSQFTILHKGIKHVVKVDFGGDVANLGLAAESQVGRFFTSRPNMVVNATNSYNTQYYNQNTMNLGLGFGKWTANANSFLVTPHHSDINTHVPCTITFSPALDLRQIYLEGFYSKQLMGAGAPPLLGGWKNGSYNLYYLSCLDDQIGLKMGDNPNEYNWESYVIDENGNRHDVEKRGHDVGFFFPNGRITYHYSSANWIYRQTAQQNASLYFENKACIQLFHRIVTAYNENLEYLNYYNANNKTVLSAKAGFYPDTPENYDRLARFSTDPIKRSLMAASVGRVEIWADAPEACHPITLKEKPFWVKGIKTLSSAFTKVQTTYLAFTAATLAKAVWADSLPKDLMRATSGMFGVNGYVDGDYFAWLELDTSAHAYRKGRIVFEDALGNEYPFGLEQEGNRFEINPTSIASEAIGGSFRVYFEWDYRELNPRFDFDISGLKDNMRLEFDSANVDYDYCYGYFDIIIEPNPALTALTAKVIVTYTSDSYSASVLRTLNISQKKFATPPLQLSPNPLITDFKAKNETLQLTYKEVWNIDTTTIPSWLGFNTLSGNGNATIDLVFLENSQETDRSATITFRTPNNADLKTINFKVIQSGCPGKLTISETLLQYEANNAPYQDIIIESSSEVSTNTLPDWIAIAPLPISDGRHTYEISVTDNPFAKNRSFVIIFTNQENLQKQLTIIQKKADITFKATPNPLRIAYDQTSASLEIEANYEFTIDYAGLPDLVSFGSESGSNPKTITFNSTDNLTLDAKIGYIFVNPTDTSITSAQRIEIIKEGTPPTLSASPLNITLPFLGGSETISVLSNGLVSVDNQTDFITIDPPLLGYIKDFEFIITADVNLSQTAKVGTIVLSLYSLEVVINVTQLANPYFLNVDKTSITFGYASNLSDILNITTNADDVTYALEPEVDWLSLDKEYDSNDEFLTNITLNAEPNPLLPARNTKLILTSEKAGIRVEIPLTQEEDPNKPNFPDSKEYVWGWNEILTPNAKEVSYNLAGTLWKPSSENANTGQQINAEWGLDFSIGGIDTQDATFAVYPLLENIGSSDREFSLKFYYGDDEANPLATITLHFKQEFNEAYIRREPEGAPTTFSIAKEGENSFAVQVASNCNYDIIASESWLSSLKNKGTPNTAEIIVAIQPNTTPFEREATIILRNDSFKKELVLTFIQEAAPYELEVTPNPLTINSEGGSVSATIIANWQFEVEFENLWEGLEYQIIDNLITFTAPANTTGYTLNGSVTLKNGDKSVVVNVIQEPVPLVFEVQPLEIIVDYREQEASFHVSSTWNFSIEQVDNSKSWLTLKPLKGLGDVSIDLQFTKNEEDFDRETTLIVKAGSQSILVKIIQTKYQPPFFLDYYEMVFYADGGVKTDNNLTCLIDSQWIVREEFLASFLAIEPKSGGIGKYPLTVHCEKNETYTNRVTTIQFDCEGDSIYLAVIQYGKQFIENEEYTRQEPPKVDIIKAYPYFQYRHLEWINAYFAAHNEVIKELYFDMLPNFVRARNIRNPYGSFYTGDEYLEFYAKWYLGVPRPAGRPGVNDLWDTGLLYDYARLSPTDHKKQPAPSEDPYYYDNMTPENGTISKDFFNKFLQILYDYSRPVANIPYVFEICRKFLSDNIQVYDTHPYKIKISFDTDDAVVFSLPYNDRTNDFIMFVEGYRNYLIPFGEKVKFETYDDTPTF